MSDNAATIIVVALVLLYFLLDYGIKAWKEVQIARAASQKAVNPPPEA